MTNRNKESGVAILLVMSAIMLLTILLANFSYDSELNKLKIFNAQDRAQARLNAEAGLNFALLKLRLYQQARNTLEKNKAIKDVISEHKVQSLITQPFIFPPPVPPSADLIQKSAVKDFVDSSVIDGHLAVSISSISGFLNPNNLRIALPKDLEGSGSSEDENDSDKGKTDTKAKLHEYIEKEFIEFLSNAIKEKREESAQMDARYSEYDPVLLIKELKYYVNDPGKFEDESKSDIEAIYSQANITPKHAPMTSISELYLLAGWTEDIISLVIDRMTVHEQGQISVNEMTESQLKMIFPKINKEQIDDFFKYRDGTPSTAGSENDGDDEENAPHPFKNVQEFKEVITGKLAIIETGAYEERMEALKKAGLQLGVAGKLFKVKSKGEKNQASVEITAIIDLPIQEEISKKKPNSETAGENDPGAGNEGSSEVPGASTPNKGGEESDKDKTTPLEFLPPRIVEIHQS